MANGEFGNTSPDLYIQQDTRACLSACLVIASEGRITEADASAALSDEGIYKPGEGSDHAPSAVLNLALHKLGMSADQLYDVGFSNNETPEEPINRLAKIQKALQDGQTVILGFGKKREDKPPIRHFAVVTGYTEDPDGGGVVIVDPSDVDGNVYNPSWDQLHEYVSPAEDYTPVIAWSISDKPTTSRQQIADTQDFPPGFDLLSNPLFKHEDRGKPVPTFTKHPTSAVLPTYNDTYNWANGGGDAALSRNGELPYGYPRFVIPPSVKMLASEVVGKTAALPFPTFNAASAATYLEATYGDNNAEIQEKDGLFWLEATEWTTEAWQYSGLGISSRQAEAALNGQTDNDADRLEAAQKAIKAKIGEHTGANPSDIYLFPNGMSAVFWLNQALINIGEQKPSAQFGFPYTDTFSIGMFGPHRNKTKNVLDFRNADLNGLAESVQSDGLRSVFTEYPSNPLLWTPDLDQLDAAVGVEAPIVVDDTIASIYNLDDNRLPDSVAARVTSLTKYFSGFADVMGGSIVLRPQSPHYDRLKASLEQIYENHLWYEDAETLQDNSRFFEGFMPIINYNGETIARWLQENYAGKHGPLKSVFYPATNPTKSNYDKYKKPETGGYGGLFSLEFNDPARARNFFDRLRITKGPSLGAWFTLGSMYTYLAHRQTSAVSKFGVAEDLIRISTGIENSEDLIGRLQEALDS